MEHKHHLLGRCYLSLILLLAGTCYAPPVKLTEFTTNSAAAAISALGLGTGGGLAADGTNNWTGTNNFGAGKLLVDGSPVATLDASTVTNGYPWTNVPVVAATSAANIFQGGGSTNNAGSGFVLEASTNAWAVYSNGNAVAYCTTNGSIVVQSGTKYVVIGIGGTVSCSGAITAGGNITGPSSSAIVGASSLDVGSTYKLSWSTIGKLAPNGAGRFMFQDPNNANGVTLNVSNLAAKASVIATNGFLIGGQPQWRDQIGDVTSLSKGGAAANRMELYPGSVIHVESWPNGAWGEGTCQFNHDMATTNAVFPNLYISPHVHISCTNTTTVNSNAAFSFAYNWTVAGATWTNGVRGTLYATNGITAQFVHTLLSLGHITNNAASGTISSILHYRIEHLTAAANDAGELIIHDVDIHYPVNRMGSTSPSAY